MSKKETNNQEQIHALEMLHKYLKPGDTVYTILKYCSSSGMSRRTDCVIPFIHEHTGKIDIININHWVALATGMKRSKKDEAIIINGCGMDTGFALVYNLSSIMYKGRENAGYILNKSWI
jgi:hypothetical protein